MASTSDGYGGKLTASIAALVECHKSDPEDGGDLVEWRSADEQIARWVVAVRIHGKRVQWKPTRDGAVYVCPFRSFGLWIMVNDATPRTES